MNTKNTGFTLIELLVVIAIIALLTTLLAPTFTGVTRTANRTICANNLKRVGEAISLFRGSSQTGAGARLIPTRWPVQLGDFLGSGGAFVCPDGESELEAAAVMPVDELVCVHVTTTGMDLELIEGPFVAKLSDEQFQAINWGPAHVAVPPYSPGSNPTVCWWVLEDIVHAGSDMDYEIAVRVEESGDGTLTLRVKQITGAGYNFNLIDKSDRKVLVPKSQMNGGPGSEVVLGGGGGTTSYGMNSAINDISDSAGKIMVLDYPWFVAKSTHNWSDETFASDVPGIPIFARHHGMVNALFPGGDVHLKRPDEIDPDDPNIQRTMWNK
ncbi:MAG: prepilin-type N-terminal cleavage/methylation domain-containing protein [Phycisphaerales bacterium]|jgi:prepilin-type N-terminal cleavage/methylation domain-containing protein|nr:prepilin-type N-terminal cleavage/methylation domain-containing protein [Phycisphaerales bacterium]